MAEEEVLARQAEHLKTVLTEKGLPQFRFAKMFNFSTSTVSEWMNGKRQMSDSCARMICGKWPEYPVDWLRGFEYGRNPQDDFIEKMVEGREDAGMMFGAFCYLAKLNGYVVDVPFARADSIEETIGCISTGFATISRDGNKVELSMDDFYELQNEFVDYAGMRLGRLLKRGKR